MTRRLLTINRRIVILAVLALVAVGATSRAAAQTAYAEDAAEVLARTDEILLDIVPLIQECDSQQARRIFEDAKHKQRQAHQLLTQERPVFAVRVSLRAREQAREAERLARASLISQEQLRQRIEYLRELWERTRDRAQETGNAQAMRFVQEAAELFQRARELHAQTQYVQALALLRQSEAHLKRAVQILFESGDLERITNEIDRTAELIALAGERLAEVDDPALQDLLERARENLERSQQALAEQRPLLALRLARQAREQAQAVLRQLGPAPDADGIGNQIERFDDQQAVVAEQVQASGDPEAARLLDRARELRDQAQQSLEQGRLEQALRRIRTALNLQRQAAERTR